MKELRKIVGDITVCIVGNKTDLEKNRNVPKEEAEQYVCYIVKPGILVNIVQVRRISEG